MGLKSWFGQSLRTAKSIVSLEGSFDSLLLLVDTVPNFAGFSIRKDKVNALFWILHLFLMFYIYFCGNVVYQVWYAGGADDFIKSYVNISILILTLNASYWFLTKRPLIKSVIKKAKRSDDAVTNLPYLQDEHKKSLRPIKIVLLIFYGTNVINASTLYIRHRTTLTTEFATIPCVGIAPLTETPKRELCASMLIIQELTIMVVVLNYQALLILLIAHTGTMYRLLSSEIMTLNNQGINVREKLLEIVEKHVLIIGTVNDLKTLYSVPIGIDFASNAVCISLFFYLPLQDWLRFMPILVYCFLVFSLYCFLCQKIVDGAETLERAIYSCGWETFSVQERKVVYLMLMQAQQKREILAADIIPVNIYTFATTLQAMFKFVTVVKF